MYSPMHDMDSCNIIQAQFNFIKGTWSSACRRGVRIKFVGAKNRSANGEDQNMLVVSSMVKAMKVSKKSKAKYTS